MRRSINKKNPLIFTKLLMSFTNIQKKYSAKNMKKLIKTQVKNVFIFQPSININTHTSSFKFVEYYKEELEFQLPLNM
jgi:hypothetical protein